MALKRCHPHYKTVILLLRPIAFGLRPIAIGYMWRRLASKCANAYAIPKVTPFLSPKQLGVGVPGVARRQYMQPGEF